MCFDLYQIEEMHVFHNPNSVDYMEMLLGVNQYRQSMFVVEGVIQCRDRRDVYPTWHEADILVMILEEDR
jgi:hypothetical protein